MDENKILLETIGQRLRFVRSVLNLTQTTVAECLGITKQTLIRYEKNDRKPNDNFLRLFSKEFNVDYDWLLTGNGVPYNFFQKPLLPKVTYDRQLLYRVIFAVESYFFASRKVMKPEKKADFIVTLYEFYSDQQDDIRQQTKDKDFVIVVGSIENAMKLLNIE